MIFSGLPRSSMVFHGVSECFMVHLGRLRQIMADHGRPRQMMHAVDPDDTMQMMQMQMRVVENNCWRISSESRTVVQGLVLDFFGCVASFYLGTVLYCSVIPRSGRRVGLAHAMLLERGFNQLTLYRYFSSKLTKRQGSFQGQSHWLEGQWRPCCLPEQRCKTPKKHKLMQMFAPDGKKRWCARIARIYFKFEAVFTQRPSPTVPPHCCSNPCQGWSQGTSSCKGWQVPENTR